MIRLAEGRHGMKKLYGPVTLLCSVALANLATAQLGVVDWFGVSVTAGTWLAGFALVARDATHETLGRKWVAGTILVGAAITALMDPRLAAASGTAFLLSETADFAVYGPLRKRGKVKAALASNLVGSVVDSLAFLILAGFPLYLAGAQVVVKYAATSAFVVAVWGCRALLRKSV